jgi:peptidoglycan LD-endopeptidase LytH
MRPRRPGSLPAVSNAGDATMRSSRFLLPFSLGAISMLALVIAIAWAAPGMLIRVGTALRPRAPLPAPALPPAVPPATVAVRPADSVPDAPSAIADSITADSAPDLPSVIAAPSSIPAAPPPSSSGRGLLIPVQGVKAASLVNTYDQSRGRGRRHDAIDIMAARGTPVLAVADGTVMKLFRSGRGGITLYHLAPDGRTIYYYAHLDRYAAGIAEKQALRRGQLLGYVGNTGDAGPGNYHLHFEVSTMVAPGQYWGGTSQNPYPLLR